MENFKLVDDRQNPLFNRREIKASVDNDVTPNYDEVGKLIAKKLDTKVEKIKVKNVLGKFGSNTFTLVANIYESEKEKNQNEPMTKKEKEEAERLKKEKEDKAKAEKEAKAKAEESKKAEGEKIAEANEVKKEEAEIKKTEEAPIEIKEQPAETIEPEVQSDSSSDNKPDTSEPQSGEAKLEEKKE
ncbi:MAG: hypothetical protein ABIB79_02495 [archaeon]